MTYEYEGKNEREAIEIAARELGLERDQFDVEILETQRNGIFKKGFVKIRVHVEDKVQHSRNSGSESFAAGDAGNSKKSTNSVPENEFEAKLIDFLTNVIERMGYDIQIEVLFRENHKIGLKLNSSASSILIGRKGKNLDALQLLANVFAGNNGYDKLRVILDAESYRLRREESLVRLAYTTADKVRSTRNSVLLEPMNPFERRLIHTTLNDIPDVETKSEGDGLYKQVRVIFKGVR